MAVVVQGKSPEVPIMMVASLGVSVIGSQQLSISIAEFKDQSFVKSQPATDSD